MKADTSRVDTPKSQSQNLTTTSSYRPRLPTRTSVFAARKDVVSEMGQSIGQEEPKASNDDLVSEVKLLLGALTTKSVHLKEGTELSASLRKRLVNFADELEKIAPATLQGDDLLPHLRALIEEILNAVTDYADESNFIKRVKTANNFSEKIKVFNEDLDSLISSVSTVVTYDWCNQYAQDFKNDDRTTLPSRRPRKRDLEQ